MTEMWLPDPVPAMVQTCDRCDFVTIGSEDWVRAQLRQHWDDHFGDFLHPIWPTRDTDDPTKYRRFFDQEGAEVPGPEGES